MRLGGFQWNTVVRWWPDMMAAALRVICYSSDHGGASVTATRLVL